MAIHAVVSSAWTDPKPSIFVVFNSIKEVFADLYKTKKWSLALHSLHPQQFTLHGYLLHVRSTVIQSQLYSKLNKHVKCIATKNVDKRSATNYLKLM